MREISQCNLNKDFIESMQRAIEMLKNEVYICTEFKIDTSMSMTNNNGCTKSTPEISIRAELKAIK